MESRSFVCFGAGEKSKYARNLLEGHTDIRICGYVEDQAFSKIGTALDGVEVISIYNLKKRYENGEIAGVIITTAYHKRTVQDIVKSCIDLGIKDKDIYLIRHNTLCSSPEDGRWIVPYKECVQIYELNIHLVDHCNLNCELCCHNSQFVEGEVFVDFCSYCRDLDRLHELVPDIQRISLLGGEPFLHPDLDKFLDYTRKKYPYADIFLTTNGTLLKRSSEALLKRLRENKIELVISLYPPMHECLDDLLSYIREHELAANVHRVEKFYKLFNQNPIYDAQEMSSYCGYCMALRNGRISKCIQATYIDYFNNRFGKTFPEATGIDLHDEALDPVKLMHDLEQPLELCRYCDQKHVPINMFQWKRLSPATKKEDILLL